MADLKTGMKELLQVVGIGLAIVVALSIMISSFGVGWAQQIVGGFSKLILLGMAILGIFAAYMFIGQKVSGREGMFKVIIGVLLLVGVLWTLSSFHILSMSMYTQSLQAMVGP